MTETTTPDKELRVGDGWRYQCWKCNRQVKIDKPFPKTCPGCGAGGWWGHLVTPDITQNLNDVKRDGVDNKNSEVKMPEGIMGRKRILSQLPDAVGHCQRHSEGVIEPPPARGRGRPRQQMPEGLDQLSQQGLSSRQIAADLSARGFHISYKSIQRYFVRQKQGVLL